MSDQIQPAAEVAPTNGVNRFCAAPKSSRSTVDASEAGAHPSTGMIEWTSVPRGPHAVRPQVRAFRSPVPGRFF